MLAAVVVCEKAPPNIEPQRAPKDAEPIVRAASFAVDFGQLAFHNVIWSGVYHNPMSVAIGPQRGLTFIDMCHTVYSDSRGVAQHTNQYGQDFSE